MATKRRVFCDTNYLLDVFDADREFHADAIALLWYASENPDTVELLASITSFKDSYYILTRLYRDEPQARDSISSIMGTYVQPADMLARYGSEALESNEQDFEDALIAACALHEGASAIITRDEKAFATCGIPILSAAEYLKQVDFDYSKIDIR